MPPSDAGLVRRTIVVLRTVAAHSDGVGLSDVARECGIPKATCYRVLSVLERESWVILDPHTRRYHVSLGLLSIVGSLLDRDGAYSHMRELLGRLAQETSETCGFDVLLPPDVMVVAQVAGPQLIGHTVKPVPRAQAVWATSTGKAFLAYQDPDTVREEFGKKFAATAPKTLGSFDAFFDSLVEVRELGYATSRDELEVGASSVAAPIHVGDTVPYALWIGGPTYRFTDQRVDELADQVQQAAKLLGGLLAITGLELPISASEWQR